MCICISKVFPKIPPIGSISRFPGLQCLGSVVSHPQASIMSQLWLCQQAGTVGTVTMTDHWRGVYGGYWLSPSVDGRDRTGICHLAVALSAWSSSLQFSLTTGSPRYSSPKSLACHITPVYIRTQFGTSSLKRFVLLVWAGNGIHVHVCA